MMTTIADLSIGFDPRRLIRSLLPKEPCRWQQSRLYSSAPGFACNAGVPGSTLLTPAHGPLEISGL